jgi:hypothetical protein
MHQKLQLVRPACSGFRNVYVGDTLKTLEPWILQAHPLNRCGEELCLLKPLNAHLH